MPDAGGRPTFNDFVGLGNAFRSLRDQELERQKTQLDIQNAQQAGVLQQEQIRGAKMQNDYDEELNPSKLRKEKLELAATAAKTLLPGVQSAVAMASNHPDDPTYQYQAQTAFAEYYNALPDGWDVDVNSINMEDGTLEVIHTPTGERRKRGLFNAEDFRYGLSAVSDPKIAEQLIEEVGRGEYEIRQYNRISALNPQVLVNEQGQQVHAVMVQDPLTGTSGSKKVNPTGASRPTLRFYDAASGQELSAEDVKAGGFLGTDSAKGLAELEKENYSVRLEAAKIKSELAQASYYHQSATAVKEQGKRAPTALESKVNMLTEALQNPNSVKAKAIMGVLATEDQNSRWRTFTTMVQEQGLDPTDPEDADSIQQLANILRLPYGEESAQPTPGFGIEMINPGPKPTGQLEDPNAAAARLQQKMGAK